MIVRNKDRGRPKGWFEEWLDLSIMEKLVTLMWCGLTYMIWVMCGSLDVMYKIPISIGVWIVLTLLCYLFGKIMSEMDWD